MGEVFPSNCLHRFSGEEKKDFFNVEIAFKKLLVIVVLIFFGSTDGHAQIAAWDFTDVSSAETSTATSFDPNLSINNNGNLLTRGPGAPPSSAANTFRTLQFKNDGISTSNTDYFQIKLTAKNGYTVSLSTIDALVDGTAAFSVLPGVANQFAYSLDGTSFILVGTPEMITGTKKTLKQIDLSQIAALQKVSAGTTITIRFYASGQTTTGGWGFYSPLKGKYGLAIGGSVDAIPTPSSLSFVSFPANATTGLAVSPFSVETRKADNSVDLSFSDNITLSKFSGPGNINGTVTVKAQNGIATFSDITFDQAGSYSIKAEAQNATPATSAVISIADPVQSTSTSNYFRSNASGSWQDPSSWQTSTDKINWVISTLVPDQSSGGISIRNGHTIKLAADVTAKLLTIEPGGTLTNTNTSGGYQLTITDDGTSKPDFEIYGNYILFGKSTQFNAGATSVVYDKGLVRADDNTGASENFALSTQVTFKTGAVFEWNNGKVFNTGTVSYFPNSISDIPIFRISKSTPPLGTTKDNIFNCLLEVNANTSFTKTGDKHFVYGIIGTSLLSIDTGTSKYYIDSPDGILGGSVNIVLRNILRFSNGILIPKGASVKVSGTGSLKNEGDLFTINGLIDVSDLKVTISAGKVILNGTIKTSNSNGLKGTGCNFSNSATIIFNDGNTIEYNGANQEITSTTVLDAPYYNIIFSGSGRKTLNSGIDVHPNGSLKITGESVIVDASQKNIASELSNNTAFIMDGGRLILGTSSNVPLPLMQGNYNISGGVIEFNHSGNITQTIRTNNYQNIEITGDNVGNSSGNITLNKNGTFTVKPTGVFQISANSITCPAGGGIVTVENGGIFKTANNQGFHGFTTNASFQYSSIHSNITDIRLLPGSTVEYNSSTTQPITADKLIYKKIIFSGNGKKILPKDELIIEENITTSANSIFDHNGGTIILNGTNEQVISGGLISFFNLINKNSTGVKLMNDVAVYHTLTLSDNSKTILSAGNIHLKSGADLTANIAKIPESAQIAYDLGRFVVERFIPQHGKAWQLLAAPTKGQTIKEAWQEGNIPGGNLKPGYGIQITSNLPNATSLGFDISSVSPSMKTFNPVQNDWIGIPNTNSQLMDNPFGFMVFVRGDRSVTKIDQPSVATTLRTTGKVFSPGEEAPKEIQIAANTFATIGNPYASSINFDQIIKSPGIDNTYYVWDALLTSSDYSAFGYGGYRTISGNSVVPLSGKYCDENNLPSIQSGQAFFVHASEAGTIKFDENCKIDGSASIFRTTNRFAKADARFRVNIYAGKTVTDIPADGILIEFHPSYLNALDSWDARKMSVSGVNFSVFTQGKNISIERRNRPLINDTIHFNISHLSAGNYLFEILPGKMEQFGMEMILEDKFLKTYTSLALSGASTISFSVISDKLSAANDRFQVLFKAAGGPLPVSFLSIDAQVIKNEILVQWKAEDENDISYELEKSTNGILFFKVDQQQSKNQNPSIYNWTDETPNNGPNYYRVKIISTDNKEEFSQTVKLNLNQESSICVYPNPLVGRKVEFKFTGQELGKYSVKVINSSGKQIISKDFLLKTTNSFQTIYLPQQLSHGIYEAIISKPNGKPVSIELVY
jgi:hypothetical protein